jgi:uncharacterized membrane-anchored protein YitT (DUF2179 family)
MTTMSRNSSIGNGRHSAVGDAHAIGIGSILLVLVLVVLQAAGLVTGGMAGIALLIGHVVSLPVGIILAAINVPFFVFAHLAMGRYFAIKAVLVNVGIATFSMLARLAIHVDSVHPVFAALVGGTIIGMGILVLTRHHAGVGGIGVLVLWLQHARGWHPGRSQIVMDLMIVAAAVPVLDGFRIRLSMLSAGATSLMLLAWHRPDQYIAK